MGNNDADSCVPAQVTDFIFDLSDSVTLSQIAEEQAKLYTTTFRELCTKYFASTPWPSPQAIASECNGHPLFLAIYREVTHRHWHSVSRPTVRDRLEGWSVYKEVLDELLDDDSVQQSQAPFYLLPDWTFDMLHEFVYQFQGFCQFRAAVYAAAKKHNVPTDGSATSGNVPHHLQENLSQLNLHKDAWAVESVVYYLHRLQEVGKKSKFPGYQYLGIFASIALSRLECLLGDHQGCLIAADAMMGLSITDGEETVCAKDVVQSVVGARLSHAYHISVAYLMTRRYQMAITTLGSTCTYLARGFKTGQFATRKSQGDGNNTAQYSKLYDRMVALLAILTHICPPRTQLEESLLRSIREKHGSQLAKMDDTTATPAGSTPRNVYQDLFCFASPKFISPTAGASSDVYKLQVRQFNAQMAAQQESRKLRSYMKLYTSIELSKLAAFYDDSNPAAFTSLLLSYKHVMLQEEENGEKKSALDIHYHLQGNMVNVDEAEKQRRFENYFMAQIRQNDDISRNVEQISTVV